MTIQELIACEDDFVYPDDVCKILGCDPHRIRLTAKANPRLLGFPVTVIGTRVRIWRVPFLRYIGALDDGNGQSK